jgi:hypothetical protein
MKDLKNNYGHCSNNYFLPSLLQSSIIKKQWQSYKK